MDTKQLQEFFEENEFNVFLSEQDDVQCAEVEKWTKGGVDMIIWLQPFSVEEFKKYVNDFDVDEEITRHREDPRYKNDFTIRESLEDFTDFHNHLKDIVSKIESYGVDDKFRRVYKEPKNVTVVQLENADADHIGLYLTTRTDTQEFQGEFDAVIHEAYEMEEAQQELDEDWDIRTYVDDKMAEVYGLHRVIAELVTTDIL